MPTVKLFQWLYICDIYSFLAYLCDSESTVFWCCCDSLVPFWKLQFHLYQHQYNVTNSIINILLQLEFQHHPEKLNEFIDWWKVVFTTAIYNFRPTLYEQAGKWWFMGHSLGWTEKWAQTSYIAVGDDDEIAQSHTPHLTALNQWCVKIVKSSLDP